MFGLDGKQIKEAGEVLKVIAADWRDLSAGSEGYLTGRDRAGMLNHRVVWGEMDSMVCFHLLFALSTFLDWE